ncbi:MAG: hypothetical protein HY685_06525 [Chloroflexi bacterium]|nr:hypothetical protein [Chloroflexota bacterium]
MTQSVWIRAVVAGLVASVVMGMWQMVIEAVAGEGLFAPPVFIGATVLRELQGVQGAPGIGPWEPLAILLGLMGHMMNSVLLALVFAAVAPRIVRAWFGLVVLGMVWGAAVFVVMWAIVIPLVDPAMLRLNGATFFVGHLMWGAAVGAIIGWAPVSVQRRLAA